MPTRRAILKSSLRWTGLAALGAVTAHLARRSLNAECTVSGPCGGCPQFSGCALPKAKSAQQSKHAPPYSSEPGNA